MYRNRKQKERDRNKQINKETKKQRKMKKKLSFQIQTTHSLSLFHAISNPLPLIPSLIIIQSPTLCLSLCIYIYIHIFIHTHENIILPLPLPLLLLSPFLSYNTYLSIYMFLTKAWEQIGKHSPYGRLGEHTGVLQGWTR